MADHIYRILIATRNFPEPFHYSQTMSKDTALRMAEVLDANHSVKKVMVFEHLIGPGIAIFPEPKTEIALAVKRKNKKK